MGSGGEGEFSKGGVPARSDFYSADPGGLRPAETRRLLGVAAGVRPVYREVDHLPSDARQDSCPWYWCLGAVYGRGRVKR